MCEQGERMSEIKPVRIHRSRAEGAKMISPNGLPVKYVGRPNKWGNPFKICHLMNKEQCAYNFRDWIEGKSWGRYMQHRREEMLRCLPELRGKNLACWCKLSEPCHADVLLELANAPEQPHE
jgi:hypothetical protein